MFKPIIIVIASSTITINRDAVRKDGLRQQTFRWTIRSFEEGNPNVQVETWEFPEMGVPL